MRKERHQVQTEDGARDETPRETLIRYAVMTPVIIVLCIGMVLFRGAYDRRARHQRRGS